jgi:hypothetical protein
MSFTYFSALYTLLLGCQLTAYWHSTAWSLGAAIKINFHGFAIFASLVDHIRSMLLFLVG